MTKTPCNCESHGYCPAHRRGMNEGQFHKCRNRRGWFEVYQRGKFALLDREQGTYRDRIELQLNKGPGTELVLILAGTVWKWLNIKITTGCKCLKYAKSMNHQGSDWCENNLPIVTEWLHNEHNHQRIKLPFSKTVAKMLIKTAIRRARKHGSGTDRA